MKPTHIICCFIIFILLPSFSDQARVMLWSVGFCLDLVVFGAIVTTVSGIWYELLFFGEI